VGLVIEWALNGLAGLALVVGARRSLAVRVGLAGMLLALSQRFSNHGALLVIVLAFVALKPPDLASERFESEVRPNLGLVRAQLVIVYSASAFAKITHGFASGLALVTLFGWNPREAHVLATAVIVAEAGAPILLVLRPRAGLAAVALLHTTMAILLPSVWPFSLTMIALAALFAGPAPARNDRDQPSFVPTTSR
jgi:hypothetical protein